MKKWQHVALKNSNLAGFIRKKRFADDGETIQVLVEYTDYEGVPQQRWFDEESGDVIAKKTFVPEEEQVEDEDPKAMKAIAAHNRALKGAAAK